jgi:hypothetical protein
MSAKSSNRAEAEAEAEVEVEVEGEEGEDDIPSEKGGVALAVEVVLKTTRGIFGPTDV